MLNLVVLISGGGSNLRALLERTTENGFPARVVAIGADRDADGLALGEEFGIPTFTVPYGSFANREAWGEALIENIEVWQPDVVVLSGLMRLLPASVVHRFHPNLLNTHPAFLPEFPGAHGVRDAITAGVTESGASLIIVDESVDGGPVISQERVRVHADDTEATLHERIKPVERRLLIEAVVGIANGTLNLKELARA